MTDEQKQEAFEEAESMASKVPDLLAQISDRLGASTGASAVFGEPAEQGGRTVIPVAQAIIGTGAGGGAGAREEGSGIGGGGGAITKPMGYIEVTEQEARFVPLAPPWADAKLILAYSIMALVVLRTLVRLLRP